jgi:transcription initiation factor TFIIA large subunit
LDGLGDSSDDDIDDVIFERIKLRCKMSDLGNFQEPLNSGDDVSDEDTAEQFDTENVVVCQYDKVGSVLVSEDYELH